MIWATFLPVSVLLFRAVYTDVKNGIIENRFMLAGLLVGLLSATVTGGANMFFESVKSVVIMFVALFFLYMIKGLGAGDVKLLCVLAAFFRKDSFGIVVLAFFFAAFMAVGRMLWRLIKREPLYQRGETLCFSIPITAAAFVIFWMEVRRCGL